VRTNKKDKGRGKMLAGPEWTDERIARLKQLWADGYSASKIAEELACGFSRNAILGKAFRLRLPHPKGARGNSTAAERKARAPKKLRPTTRSGRKASRLQLALNNEFAHAAPPQAPRANQFDIATRVEIRANEPGLGERFSTGEPTGVGIKVEGLTSENCHWPLGDPAKEDFEFCGANALAGFPYCAGHCLRAFNGAPPPKQTDYRALPRPRAAY
jgi:GcrA cell cycle regulator